MARPAGRASAGASGASCKRTRPRASSTPSINPSIVSFSSLVFSRAARASAAVSAAVCASASARSRSAASRASMALASRSRRSASARVRRRRPHLVPANRSMFADALRQPVAGTSGRKLGTGCQIMKTPCWAAVHKQSSGTLMRYTVYLGMFIPRYCISYSQSRPTTRRGLFAFSLTVSIY